MSNNNVSIRSTRPIQLPLIVPTPAFQSEVIEPKGVVYTKRWVVELLLDLAGYKVDRDLAESVAVEPAAGDGAFLIVMAERLIESCRREGHSLLSCEKSIVAFELNDLSAQRARDVVLNRLIQLGVEVESARHLSSTWVRRGDFLIEAHALKADFVIGNPPYIRLEEIPEEAAAYYRRSYPTMIGRADLYVAFFEAALRQLNAGGTCAFICADRWMRNQYGAELRELVTSGYSVDVLLEMHDANAFEDEVDAYPAITIIRRASQRTALVASAGAEAEKVPPSQIAAFLDASSEENGCNISRDVLRVARVHTWFSGTSPWPCQSPEQLELLRRLECNFEPLETSAKIGIGVATGSDRLFITTDPDLVEDSRLLKLALAKDIGKGTLEWSGHYLVDPWNCDGLVDLRQFPRLERYFEAHAADLKKRHTAAKNLSGWYRTIDRVTHSLAKEPKLYIADIQNYLDPVLDRGETYPHHNLYFIKSDIWDLEVLGGLLMSAVGQFFVSSYGVRMRGGYFRFQAQYLRRIRVPSPDTLTGTQMRQLREAFRLRDKDRATELAFHVYRIAPDDMERALGH
jgi:adenine-specific DNA-methyltransferase